MFSFLGGSNALLASRHDPTKERPPPPYPTKISFNLSEHVNATVWTRNTSPDLFRSFAVIRRLSDVSLHHLNALNVCIQSTSNINEFLSERQLSTNEISPRYSPFLPPPFWLDDLQVEPTSNPSTTVSRVLNNGKPYPSMQDFAIRSRELRHANGDAYRALSRQPHNGQAPPRLAHYRRFWEGLENMSSYWDASLDEYIPPKDAQEETLTSNKEGQRKAADGTHDEDTAPASPRKRPKSAPEQDEGEHVFELPVGAPPPSFPKPPSLPPHIQAQQNRRLQAALESTPPGTYKGIRIGNGATMPDAYRNDTVRAFLEPLAWSFGFTLAGHRKPPVLELKSLLVPIKLSSVVWQPPSQRDKARAGYLRGPVMGISCRGETGFAEGKADPVLDTLREIGALLCLAQERARQGVLERKPGEGKWWTSVPRWGGGKGGEMGEAFTTTEEGEGESRGRAPVRADVAKRKEAIVNAWKTLRVGVGHWDQRTEYAAVGKGLGEVWDEVFLVSSLNHHISILRLHVHKDYLEYLRTGEFPATEADPDWCRPLVQRSKWFDLFEPEDRIEAFVWLWTILGYLARND